MKAVFLFLSILIPFYAGAQTGVVRGHITGPGGVPLPAATIAVAKGTGVTADSSGAFTLAPLPYGTHSLMVSLVGYSGKRARVVVDAPEVSADVVLERDESRLSEVIVTGTSRASTLRKSPVPVAVITRKDMERSVNHNIIDAVLKGVPGMTAVTTGPNISKPFIRGLGYNRVLTMYDGLRQEGQQWGDEHGIEMDPYGIERAEVVKGPASLTYGSDALAGVVNLIPACPKGPEGKITGDGTLEYHTNNGLAGASAGLAYRKGGWKYTFRVSGKAAHNYQNPVDGYVYGTAYREYHLSGTAGVDRKWGYSRWSATLYDNGQEIPDGSRDSLSRRFTRQVAEADKDDIKARPVMPETELRTYALQPLHQRIRHYRVYTNHQFKLGSGDIHALLGYQQNIRQEFTHPTAPQQAGLSIVLNTFNYDIRYNLPVFSGAEVTVGVNGMYQTNRNKEATDFPIPDYELLDAGAFFFAKRSWGKLDIAGGVRYDTRQLSWADFYVGLHPGTGFGQRQDASDPAASLQFPAFRHPYTGVSGSLGATYNFNERVLVKANIARGYRAPNINEVGSNGLDPGAHIVYLGNRDFVPEFSLQEDLGFMAYLKDLDLSLELFHNSIDHYIYQSRLYDAAGQPVVIVPGNATYKYQQSRAQLYGAEVGLNAHPRSLSWLALNNSLAYTVGRNRNEALIARYGDGAQYLPFVPPLQGRSEARATLGRLGKWLRQPYVQAEVQWAAAQDRFYGVDATETFTPGYTLVHAGIGTGVTDKKGRELFRIHLQADNLLDRAYQSHLNRLKYFEYYTAAPNGRSGIYNMGRNMSVKVTVPF